MNELKIKVIGLQDVGISELYFYYLDNNENIVATLAVNSQGDLVSNIFNNAYKDKIALDINKISGYQMETEDEYYITGNKQVWNNTQKYINDNNLTIEYKKSLESDELDNKPTK